MTPNKQLFGVIFGNDTSVMTLKHKFSNNSPTPTLATPTHSCSSSSDDTSRLLDDIAFILLIVHMLQNRIVFLQKCVCVYMCVYVRVYLCVYVVSFPFLVKL